MAGIWRKGAEKSTPPCAGAPALPTSPPRTGGSSMRAFIFPGQGSQAVGMGKVLAEASKEARAVFEEVDEALGPESVAADGRGAGRGADPDRECPAGDHGQCRRDPARLRHRPRRPRPISSPATALANIRRSARPGTFDLATTARLLKQRGQAMQAAVPVGEGAMAALLGADLAIAQAVARRRRRARSAPSPTTMIPRRS